MPHPWAERDEPAPPRSLDPCADIPDAAEPQPYQPPPGTYARLGRKKPKNLYLVTPDCPEGLDIGRLDTPELAALVRDAVNDYLIAVDRGRQREERKTVPETIRRFHLGDILSVTTGRLVAPGGVDAVRELVDFMTGALPRAMTAEECRPYLLRQHPQLADVPVPEAFDGEEHVVAWLAEQVATYGEYLTIQPLATEGPHAGQPTDGD